MSKVGIIALGGAGAAVAGVLTYFLARKVVSAGYSVLLSDTSNTMPTGQSMYFSALVTQNGNPVNSTSVVLDDLTTGVSATSTTNAQGLAVFTVSIDAAGTYSFQATANGVKSNTVNLTVTSTSKCPCGQYYSETAGTCQPLTPSAVNFMYDNTVETLADVTLGFNVDVVLIDLALGYFVDGVTIAPGNPNQSCPTSISPPSAKTLSGTVALSVEVVDNSNTAIGCSLIDLSLNVAQLSITDALGITWYLSFTAPSSVTADSSGIADFNLSWTLTRSWNGDAAQGGIPPSSETLSFGELVLTGNVPSSLISGSIILNIKTNMCYYS